VRCGAGFRRARARRADSGLRADSGVHALTGAGQTSGTGRWPLRVLAATPPRTPAGTRPPRPGGLRVRRTWRGSPGERALGRPPRGPLPHGPRARWAAQQPPRACRCCSARLSAPLGCSRTGDAIASCFSFFPPTNSRFPTNFFVDRFTSTAGAGLWDQGVGDHVSAATRGRRAGGTRLGACERGLVAGPRVPGIRCFARPMAPCKCVLCLCPALGAVR
jgi:hypothetical protein